MFTKKSLSLQYPYGVLTTLYLMNVWKLGSNHRKDNTKNSRTLIY